MVTSTGLENQEKLYRLNKLWFFFRAQSLFQMAWNEFIEGEIDAVKTQLTYCFDSIWLNARGIYLKARVMGNAFYSARALFKRSIFHGLQVWSYCNLVTCKFWLSLQPSEYFSAGFQQCFTQCQIMSWLSLLKIDLKQDAQCNFYHFIQG